jgi:SdrD B-like domain/Bacterial Ig-like domain (group 3)/Domain of unknown function DUF11
VVIRTWLKESFGLQRTVSSRGVRRARPRTARRAKPLLLCLETLEDRTLLSAPAPYTIPEFSESGASQFGGGQSSYSDSVFLGGNFDVNAQVGGIVDGFGAEAHFALTGKAGLVASYNVSAGSVDATYNDLTLVQNYVEPTQFNQQVYFTPQNTSVSYGAGSFSTTSPSAGAGIGLLADVTGSVGAHVAFAGFTAGGDTNFSGSVDQSLISFDTQTGVQILGLPLSGDLGPLSGGAGLFVYKEVPIPGGLKLGVTVSSDTAGLYETLDLVIGFKEGSKTSPSVSGSVNLANASQTLPSIELTSDSLQGDGVLTASDKSTFADLTVQLGPLIAALLGEPGFGALASTDTIAVGPFYLSGTPVSFQLGPNLSFAQTGTVTPTNQLTYSFSDTVDVMKNGTDLGAVDSVSFTPGVDTIGIGFTGDPITVTPTWTSGMDYHNKIDLDAGIQGTLTVGQLSFMGATGTKGGTLSLSLGPLYQKDFDIADTTLATVYNQTFNIASHIQTLPSFVIGSTFTPSLNVTTTQDTTTSGSLRYAVESANILGANDSTPQIIHLGPGTYALSILASGNNDASSGDLNITGQNVVIEGAGAGQTIINASDLADGIFQVASGAHLTLDGVTLAYGYSTNGGAVYNAGTLSVSHSTLNGNFASANGGGIYNAGGEVSISNSALIQNVTSGNGGGIYNQFAGTVNISDSTLKANSSGQAGGGIYNTGALTITNSTLDGNSASTTGGGISGNGNFQSSTTTYAEITGSTLSHNHAADGGGIYDQVALTISNSTFYDNSASNDGGGLWLEYLADLVNVTLTGNRANTSGSTSNPSAGGGIYLSAQAVLIYLANTIVADNYNGSSTTPDDIHGSLDSSLGSANNLIGTGGSGGLTNGSNGNQVGVDNPGLGTLGDYGGPTKTVPLLTGSPAINAGSNSWAAAFGLVTDQRGYPRVIDGHVDIGAVEYQYDLQVSGNVGLSPTLPQHVLYEYTVTNNGPDPVAGATLTVPLPLVFDWYSAPAGWTVSYPTLPPFTGTVTFRGDLASGQSASLAIIALQPNAAAGTTFPNTATVGPTPGDSNPQNNSVTLTVTTAQEGQTFKNVTLFRFTDPNASATANIFTAAVGWGDGDGNVSNDGTGTVSVVADPNGGFDVLGSHSYAEEGAYGAAIVVTGLDGTKHSNGNLTQTYQDITLGISDEVPVDATVNWGDGSSNSLSDGSNTLQSIVDSFGLYRLIGSHAYAQLGTYPVTIRWQTLSGELTFHTTLTPSGHVQVSGPQQLFFFAADAPLTAGALTSPPNAAINQPISNALLFHFTDADPNGTASDYTATVTWGDGSTNSSDDGSGTVAVVANAATGGFDVLGWHTYTQIVNPGTFRVQVSDAGGASTSASDNTFQVLYPDPPLTAGALYVPSVTTEGQSISNQVLFHFTDADPDAQASDYLAVVSWGDATFNSSNDDSGSVWVVANPSGGFDVVGSHTYGYRSFVFGVQVTGLGNPRSAQPDRGGQSAAARSDAPLTLIDPPVVVTAGPTFAASENSLSAVQTLATFTDPGSPRPNATDTGLVPAPYVALIDWGDGTVTATSLTASADYSQASVSSEGDLTGELVSASNDPGIFLGSDGQTFSVNLAHQYAEEGQYTITILINHDGMLSQVTTTADVEDPAVIATAGPSFTATEGDVSDVQTVATFTDPAGPESDDNAYVATVEWADGTSSVATLANGGIVLGDDGTTFSVRLAHQYARDGTFTITTTLDHEGVLSPPVTTTATVANSDLLAATGAAPLTSTYGEGLTGVMLATFTDTYTGAPASDFLATIDWGDGQNSTGTVSGGNGSFTVIGSHNYAYAGTYLIGVAIAEDGGATATASTTATIDRAGTATTETVSAVTPLHGVDTVTFTASVSVVAPGSGSPSGLIDFFDVTTDTDLGSVALSGGTASLTTGSLTVGQHVIEARYSGDDNFLTSTGSTALQVLQPSTLNGYVWEDFNNDGQINFGEQGISGVAVALQGTDDLGHAVDVPAITDGAGFYQFINLRPGTYYVTASQPPGYNAGIDSVGAVDGVTTGSVSAIDQFFINLAAGVDAINYNFGQRPVNDSAVTTGQTAPIGFWHNKHGQALIKSLNGGPDATQLGNWLAATFSNIFGANAGSNDLTGLTNAQVAIVYQQKFTSKGPKLDAQVMATALSVYVTNQTLAGTVAAAYGFQVTAYGTGVATFNVGNDGAAVGQENGTTMSIMDILLAVNTLSRDDNGNLYGGNTSLRHTANDLFSAINTAGNIV